MEINTGKSHQEADDPAVFVPPDKSRAARKKNTQKLPQGGRLFSGLLTALKVIGLVIVVTIAVAAAFSAYRYVRNTEILTVRSVTVGGCKYSDPSKIEAIARQKFPSNILLIDLSALQTLLEQEPWVSRAEIRRILPSSLKIDIQERTPSIIADIGGELVLLDRDGYLLDVYDSRYGKFDVPVFTGLRGDNPESYKVLQEENSARVRLGVQVMSDLQAGSEDLIRVISEIDLSDLKNVRILLVNDATEIFLGDKDFFKRLQAFVAQYPQVKSEHGEIASANLRFFPTIVYQPKQEAADGPTGGIKVRR